MKFIFFVGAFFLVFANSSVSYAKTCKGNSAYRNAVVTTKFMSGNRGRVCIGGRCFNMSYSKDSKGVLTSSNRAVRLSYTPKRYGYRMNIRWKDGHFNVRLKC